MTLEAIMPDPALPTDAWDDIYVGKELGRRDGTVSAIGSASAVVGAPSS